jgi:hypothetical protein
MADFDIRQLGVGGVIGVVLTVGANLVGIYLNRRTTIDTSKLDDRSELTQQLMGQLNQAFSDIGELRQSVSTLQRNEGTYIRLIANLGAEIRVCSGFIETAVMEMDGEGEINRPALKANLTRLNMSFVRMERLVSEGSRLFTQELKAERMEGKNEEAGKT